MTCRYSETSSLFVRHLQAGQLSPSRWDDVIRQFAEAQKLPIDRLTNAYRILNFYYPVQCRRTWTSLDEDHRADLGQHARDLAEFELAFYAPRVDERVVGQDTLERITSYLRRGRDGYWLWEALVDDVEARARLTADGKERIGRWFACKTLRAYYRYIGGRQYWDEIRHDYDGHARHVFALIRFEYEFTRIRRGRDELSRERQIAVRLASRLRDDAIRQRCAVILTAGAPMAYSDTRLPNRRGVYVKFREPGDAVPMYVGMGDIASAIARRHKRYSGDRPIYLHYFEDEHCETTEKILLSVFDPPENDHHWNGREWIRHPDELSAWFVA